MGKHSSVWGATAPLRPARALRSLVAVGLIAVGACGTRGSLHGNLAIDDDTSSGGSGGQTTNAGPTSNSVAVAAQVVSATATTFTAGSTTTTMTTTTTSTGFVPSTSAGGGMTTGVGGAPPCQPPLGGAAGQGGEGGASDGLEACPIPFCSGWADRTANCASISGGFYWYTDETNGGYSTISTDIADSRTCVSGSVSRVIDGQYEVYWGAGVGMNLNQLGYNYPPEPYNAEQQGVVGFGFSVDALPEGGELRFMVRGEDYYCTSVITTGYSRYMLADLVKGCWDPVSTPHDYSSLMSIEWHFVSNAATAYDYAVCISDLTVYRATDE